MDMSMDMPMPTTTGGSTSMAMPTSSSSMSGMTMGMPGMQMVFFTSTYTPLFSSSWVPTTTGQYVGTCIFLIVLAVIQFGLITLKSNLDATVWSPRSCCAPMGQESSEKGGESGQVLQRARASRPWRVAIDGPRAALIVAIGGLGYLL
ncbi:uncharacterized protein BP5553_01364 [Venustampulla echinocandica]|uniref:Copper transport protein n=1 Tax=Venustampulla echinocandica TaxID=2656787 RepID=A0A370U0V0_9HELO|nr:uncharacterized protein BP5553_01364 [Venustampulla echinocandica]RDL41385.1 hypothetical protein BP5553_01364 [Venustampulla echinocandica]